MSSIKKNFLYNVSITLAQYIAGFITFPYVSRCLGVELIGKTNFATNIIAYFSLFALLGVVTVGTREIAVCKNDFEKRSKVFSSICIIVFCQTIISLILLTAATICVSSLSEYKVLLFIGSFSLFFTSFQIEWLYQGVEQFDYIAKRSIIIKFLYCISIFVFIRNESDYILYFILTTLSVVINGIVNLIYSRKYVQFSLKEIEIKKYLKPICIYGVNKFLISMYTTFNVIYLGFACNDVQVGYYATANKLFTIFLGVISAFTAVILPRMSSLAAENNQNEFRKIVRQSLDLIFTVAVPITIGGVILAPQIISFLAGPGYEGAILPMQIIMPVLILTGMAQVCIMQVLIPLKKDKIVLIASIIGAVVAVLANIILVKKYNSVGTAWVLLLSELFSDMFAFGYAVKHNIMTFPIKTILYRIVLAIPYVIICMLLQSYLNVNDFVLVLLCLGLCMIYFIIENLFIRKTSSVGILMKNTFKFYENS